ncbi:MAG: hypothetical protein GXP63_07380 [DPANN group archaeon]|nr:hypothetical protein [DPANN group archaeon]
MTWTITWENKRLPRMKMPVLIEGLPGIGNVGKIVADFLAAELKAKPLASFFSPTLPHSVFVTEDNLIKLPSIEAVWIPSSVLKNGHDLILILGDVQPVDEVASYGLTDAILDLCEKCGVEEIITLGGIGLPIAPKKPKVYCTGNDPVHVASFVKGTSLKTGLYGLVGPIIGITGLLLALATKRAIKAVALLGETAAHPMYLGIKASGEMLKTLKKKFGLSLSLTQMEKEIRAVERELMKRTDDLQQISKSTALKRLKGKLSTDVDYIG